MALSKVRIATALVIAALPLGHPVVRADDQPLQGPPALEAAIAESHEALRRILNGDLSGYAALHGSPASLKRSDRAGAWSIATPIRSSRRAAPNR